MDERGVEMDKRDGSKWRAGGRTGQAWWVEVESVLVLFSAIGISEIVFSFVVFAVVRTDLVLR